VAAYYNYPRNNSRLEV